MSRLFLGIILALTTSACQTSENSSSSSSSFILETIGWTSAIGAIGFGTASYANHEKYNDSKTADEAKKYRRKTQNDVSLMWAGIGLSATAFLAKGFINSSHDTSTHDEFEVSLAPCSNGRGVGLELAWRP